MYIVTNSKNDSDINSDVSDNTVVKASIDVDNGKEEESKSDSDYHQ